jgi:hypothetical protein
MSGMVLGLATQTHTSSPLRCIDGMTLTGTDLVVLVRKARDHMCHIAKALRMEWSVWRAKVWVLARII